MEKRKCPICGKEITQYRNIYCSKKCSMRSRYLDYISKWKQGLVDGGQGNWGEVSGYIRRYLFELNDGKCSICGWGEVNPYTGNVPLEIDHIDGNPLNHSESNLRLICPNCHSLTENYRGRNVKSGKISGRGYKVTYTERTKRDGVKVLQSLQDKRVECPMCHKIFIPKKHTQIFCSVKCASLNRSIVRSANKTIKNNTLKKDDNILREELKKLVDEGLSMREMGRIYGVSDNGIKKYLKKYGLVAKTSFEYKRNNNKEK